MNNAASRLSGLFAVAILGSIASFVFTADLGAGVAVSTDARFGVLPPVDDPSRAVLESAFLSGYSAALWTAALCGAVAALIAYRFLRQPRDPAAMASAATSGC